MKRLALALSLLLLFACAPKEASEKTYKVHGKILSRDTTSRQITVDHDTIPGFMDAMTMPYPVKEIEVSKLPPDGTIIDATLHVDSHSAEYWLSDVKPSTQPLHH